MAFFDDLGKTLTQAGQAAAKKTKEVADLTKANAKIMDIRAKLDKAYAEVGRKYVELHPVADEDGMKEAVEAVYSLEDRLTVLQNELHDLKGTVRCRKCGAACDADATYCASCGAELSGNEVVVDVE